MNVYDKAYELTKAIKESSEFKALKSAVEAVNADPDAKRMMDEFKEKQMKLQEHIFSGEEPSEEESKKLEKLYEVINLNPLIGKLMETERHLHVIMEDVNRILMDSMNELNTGS